MVVGGRLEFVHRAERGGAVTGPERDHPVGRISKAEVGNHVDVELPGAGLDERKKVLRILLDPEHALAFQQEEAR